MSPSAATVPVNDLKRAALADQADLAAALIRVARSGWFVKGAEVSAFEAEFARYLDVPHCVGVGNGTDALEIALRALGIGPGHRVATVANAGFYTSTACLAVGAEPVYVDIQESDLLMSSDALQGALSRGVDAVVLTHLYGDASTAPEMAALCAQAEVPLIEDCAQAVGATIDGRRAGTFGQLATFSFYPTKNLGALGDAGAVVTASDELDVRLRRISQYGWDARYQVTQPGRNSRLDEIQAAVLRTRLPHVDGWNERRREVVRRYSDALSGTHLRMVFQDAPSHAAHLAILECPDPVLAKATLADCGIMTDLHYPIPDHAQPLWTDTGRAFPVLSATERMTGRILTLPCFPELEQSEVERVIVGLGETVGHSAAGGPTMLSEAIGPGIATRYSMNVVAQERGNLLVGEFPDHLPFIPIRFFVVSGVPAGNNRGEHAHRTCHQFLVALHGSVTCQVWDYAGHRSYTLGSQAQGLYVPPMIYGTQSDYSADAQLLVLASHPYDAGDYIDSFTEFCHLTGYRF